MMIAHPEQAFGNEIEGVFREMDMPERFNDHSLGVKVVKFPSNGNMDAVNQLKGFAKQVQLPKKMVSKWFSRDKQTGLFSMDLLAERGLYNATKQEFVVAQKTLRGKHLLADAGEKLIGHTFWVMCEYTYQRTYSDRNNNDQKAERKKSRDIDLSGAEAQDEYNSYLNQMDKRLQRFDVTCTSYLFRLDWNDSVAAVFYSNYYVAEPDPAKINAFMEDNSTFTISYVGSCTDALSESNVDGQYTNQQLIKKVCTRLRDKNLSTLQHTYPDFRIKALLVGTEPLTAYVGLKEDITASSR